MKIKLSYLYRDGANYKRFNEAIFNNPNNYSCKEVEALIKENLIEEQWFVANEWGLLDLHFNEYSWDSEIDHDWHEFISIEQTSDVATEKNNITEFLLGISKAKSRIP